MTNAHPIVSLFACCFVVASCGGGGSESSVGAPPAAAPATPAPPPQGPTVPGVASAEGLWVGTGSQDFTSPRLLILENGEVWNIYGGGNAISGVLQGVTSWDGSRITSTVTDFNGRGGAIAASTLAGTYTAKGTLQATTLHAGTTVTLSTRYQASYEIPATLAQVQGYWQTLTYSRGGRVSSDVNISAAGAITTSSVYCRGSGTVRPRPSGKNVFDVVLSFPGGGDCEFQGKTISGVAYVESPTLADRLLLIGAVQSDKLNGVAGYGIR